MDTLLFVRRETRLGVEGDAVAACGGLDELGIFLLETGKILLGVPIPDAVGSEEEVHFLQSALIGLWVEGPDDRNRDGVGNAKNVEGLFTDMVEHDWAKEGEPAVSDGPTNDAPGVTFGSDVEWEDLGWVEPRHLNIVSFLNGQTE